MKLENLQIFLAVANYKSMTAAANSFFLAPQNVSKIIAKMEEELGTVLFVRTRQGCYLTNTGRDLYNTSTEILQNWSKFQNSLSRTAVEESLTGRINILTSNLLSHLIFSFVKQFQNAYPRVTINLEEQDTLYISGEIINSNTYDAIFSSYEEEWLYNKNASSSRSHHIFLLNKEPLRLFFSKNNSFFIDKTIISNTILNEIPLVLVHPKGTDKTIFSDALTKRGIHPKYIFSSNNIEFCQNYILNDTASYLDTTLMFNSTFHPLFLPEIASLPLQEKINICHVVFLRETTDLPDIVKLFIDQFKLHYNLTEI